MTNINEKRRLEAVEVQENRASFEALVKKHHRSMVRVALGYVSDMAIAEEVVQDTWIAVLKGIARFEGRSALKTWIFRILTFQAQKRAVREARMVSLSSWDQNGGNDPVPAQMETQWAHTPVHWGLDPEDRMARVDVLDTIRGAIEELPQTQKTVLYLRDVEQWSSHEVCSALDLSQGNQRILLHRARGRMRAMLTERLAA